MKAVILHGTNGSSNHNWFPWLKAELEKIGYEVWVPDLPESDNPSVIRYNKFLLESGWDFTNNLIIGHSSGSVEILGLLQELPDGISINTAILLGTFENDLDRDDLKGMNVPFDFEKIKTKAKQFIVIHSDNDPYCPLEGAQAIAKKLGVEITLFPGFAHFGISQDPKFVKFPELLEIIKEKVK